MTSEFAGRPKSGPTPTASEAPAFAPVPIYDRASMKRRRRSADAPAAKGRRRSRIPPVAWAAVPAVAIAALGAGVFLQDGAAPRGSAPVEEQPVALAQLTSTEAPPTLPALEAAAAPTPEPEPATAAPERPAAAPARKPAASAAPRVRPAPATNAAESGVETSTETEAPLPRTQEADTLSVGAQPVAPTAVPGEAAEPAAAAPSTPPVIAPLEPDPTAPQAAPPPAVY